MTNNEIYRGQELDLFSEAKIWKNYWISRIHKYIGNDVLEVGAGIGVNTFLLCNKKHKRWICLEPDSALSKRIDINLHKSKIKNQCKVVNGKLNSLQKNLSEYLGFDTILYLDVLEHIKNDKEELEKASFMLKPKGFLVVLAPAHSFLYSRFDKNIGHYRRYSKKRLLQVAPKSTSLVKLEYMDSIGLMASLANKLLLKQKLPTMSQIEFWNTKLIQYSQKIDPIFNWNIGKSIIAVWKKNTNNFMA